MDFSGMNERSARASADSNLPRLKPGGLKRGFFRSAEALLPRMNAGAPTERRRGSVRDAASADSNLPRLKPEGLKRGFFRSAEALLPRMNAGAPTERQGEAPRRSLPRMNVGAPTERRRGPVRDAEAVHSYFPRLKPAWVIAASGIVAVAALGAAITAATVTLDRAESFFGLRAYPAGYIPAGARERTIEQMRAMSASAGSDQLVWKSIAMDSTAAANYDGAFGPAGAIAPVRAIEIDPTDPTGKTVYVGAASGGVWKTTDGVNWIPLTDNQPSLAIRSLALDATTSPVTIYAGTGARTAAGNSFYGAGVMKSADGGKTWSATGSAAFSSAGNGGVSIEAISVSPNSGTRRDVLAAVSGSAGAPSVPSGSTSGGTASGGVWRSTDGGATWATVLTAGASVAGFDVAFDPNDRSGMTAYAALGRDNGSGAASAACLTRCGGLFVSTDAGASWKRLAGFDQISDQIFNRVQTGRVSLALGAQSAGKTILYAAIADATPGSANLLGIFKSNDGGATWMTISDPPNHLCAGECFDAMTLRASATDPSVVFAGGAGLARSIDGGSSWQDVMIDRTHTALYPGQHSIAVSSNDSVLYVGNDGGVWSSADVADAGVAAGSHTWSNINGKSSASGLNISQLDDGPSGSAALRQIGIGASASGAHAAGLPNRVQTSSAADPRDARVAYATFSGFSGMNGDTLGHVFMTASGGAEWSDISGNLPNIPVNSVVADPEIADTLYVATDIGVFATNDRGAAWTQLGAGLPIVPVTSLALQPASRVLTAATFGRGAWDLRLGGGMAFHLTSLSPASAAVGAASFTLNVKGSGFTNQSTIRLNSTALTPTTLKADGSLAAIVPAGLLKTGGAINVSVIDNGSVTNSVVLAVTNPVPTLTSISPTSVTVGFGEFDLTVTGTNFVTGSVINFGNTSLTPIGSQSSTSLTVEVPTNAFATAAVIAVSVTNPAPGGGTTSTISFDVQDYAYGPITPTIATVTGGFTAQYKIPVIALNGFDVPLTLTCTGAPSNSVCSFEPTSITPTASGATETMLVTTESNTFAPPMGGRDRGIPPELRKFWPALAGVLGIMLLIAWLSGRAGNRAWRRRFALATSLAGITFAGILAGCSSGGSGGTPVGTYQITITAAEETTSGVITVAIASHQVMVTLIVQQTPQ